jgi:SHS family lactate transporter-like MFS transporter
MGAFTEYILIQMMVQGAWGVIPAHLSELSPDSVRGFLPGFAYQCGILVSSSIGILQALIAQHVSYALTMAITAGTVFAGGAIVTALGKERHAKAFGAARISVAFPPDMVAEP